MVLSLCAIILLFSLLALLVVPARFYKKNSLLMQKFCLRMIFVEKFRKLYTLGLLMALIMAHYGAHVIMPNEPGVLISSVLCLIFFNFRWTEMIPRFTLPWDCYVSCFCTRRICSVFLFL